MSAQGKCIQQGVKKTLKNIHPCTNQKKQSEAKHRCISKMQRQSKIAMRKSKKLLIGEDLYPAHMRLKSKSQLHEAKKAPHTNMKAWNKTNKVSY